MGGASSGACNCVAVLLSCSARSATEAATVTPPVLLLLLLL